MQCDAYHFYKYQGKGKKIVSSLLLITPISVTFMIYTYSIELYSTYLFHIFPSLLTLTSEIKYYKIITKHFMQKFVILEDFCWLKVGIYELSTVLPFQACQLPNSIAITLTIFSS